MLTPIIFRMYNEDEEIIGLLPTISSGHGPHGIVAFTKDSKKAIFTSTADMQPQITSAVDPAKNWEACLAIVQHANQAGHYPLEVRERIMEHMNEQRKLSLKHLTTNANKKTKERLQEAA